jgi:hypothetical protein
MEGLKELKEDSAIGRVMNSWSTIITFWPTIHVAANDA